MNELDIFLTGLLFSCVTGALLGAVLASAFKRLARTLAALAAISGLCALVIVAAWVLCVAVGGAGFVGYLCNLLIAPAAYIGVFTGWNIYSYALGMLIQIGLMTSAGWLIWHWITAREKRKCEHHLALYVADAPKVKVNVRQMDDEMTKDETIRGNANVWTASSQCNIGWPFGRITISELSVSLGRRIIPKSTIQELRWIRWPLPAIIIIANIDGSPLRVCFSVFKSAALQQALAAACYSITSEHKWHSAQMVRDDVKRLGLYDSPAIE